MSKIFNKIAEEMSASSNDLLEVLNGTWTRQADESTGHYLSCFDLPVGMMLCIPPTTTGEYRAAPGEVFISTVNDKYELYLTPFDDPEEGPLQAIQHNSEDYDFDKNTKTTTPKDHNMITMAWVVEKIIVKSSHVGVVPIITRAEVLQHIQNILDNGY
jgi:hypothetical protein